MIYISVDLGGTNSRIAKTDTLDVASFTEMPIRRRNTHSYSNDLAFIINAARKFSNGSPIDAVGIGIAGRVNSDKSTMVASHNLPEWTDRKFCFDLSKALGCPVYMDNDGVAGGLGEGYFGNLKDDFHYIIWGTGISGVSVKHRDNGEITATYIRPDFQDHFNMWETQCGGAALLRIYDKPGEQLTTSEWTEVSSRFADYLQGYVDVARPPAIIFAGGLATHHAATITSHADGLSIPIRITQFDDNSGLIGGLGLIRRGMVSATP